MQEKICRTCKKIKSMEEFSPDKRKPFGVISQCRECARVAAREYIQRRKEELKNREPRPLKACIKCKAVKTSSEFGKNSMASSLLKSKCKECEKEEREEVAPLRKAKYEANRESIRARRKVYERQYYWKKKYGVTIGQVEEINDSQDSRCAICGDVPKEGGCLHLDHCHKTGKVRGLLCSPCSLALGLFKDNAANLEQAITYLKKDQ